MITESELDTYTIEERKQLLSWLMRRMQRSKRAGTRIDFLASFAVGESKTFPIVRSTMRNAVSNISKAKERAREELNEPEAQWKTQQTNFGVRVTRIK